MIVDSDHLGTSALGLQSLDNHLDPAVHCHTSVGQEGYLCWIGGVAFAMDASAEEDEDFDLDDDFAQAKAFGDLEYSARKGSIEEFAFYSTPGKPVVVAEGLPTFVVDGMRMGSCKDSANDLESAVPDQARCARSAASPAAIDIDSDHALKMEHCSVDEQVIEWDFVKADRRVRSYVWV